MNRRLLVVLSLGFLLISLQPALAGHLCGGCAPCDPCVEKQCVEKTIYVPEWVNEVRKVMVCEYRQEQREVKETVYQCVSEVQEVERCCVVMVPEQRTQTVPYAVCEPVIKEVERQYTVCVPVWKDVERQYTVMVPVQETRQGVRRVCQMVEEEVTQTVCVDKGHWETQMVEVPCSPCRLGLLRRHCCDPCNCCCKPCTTTVCKNVWVPNVVQEEIKCKVCKPQVVEEPCEYTVTVCKPEVRTCTVRECEYKYETRTRTCQVTTYETSMETREVTCTVCVPQKKTWTEKVTVYKQVPQEVVRTITCCVPQQVEKEVQVRVCRMVPKVVQVQVAPCGGCCRGCGLFACRRGCGC